MEFLRTYEILFGPNNTLKTGADLRKAYGRLSIPPWFGDFPQRQGPVRDKFWTWELFGMLKRILYQLFCGLIDILANVTDSRWSDYRSNLHRTISYRLDVTIDVKTDHGIHLWFMYKHTHTPDSMAYEDFPIFAPRIRELKEYMAKPKARTLGDLWRDSRETYAWFTFWAVVVFGGLTLLLTLVSLGVSSAQTYAAFRAIPVSSGIPTNSVNALS